MGQDIWVQLVWAHPAVDGGVTPGSGAKSAAKLVRNVLLKSWRPANWDALVLHVYSTGTRLELLVVLMATGNPLVLRWYFTGATLALCRRHYGGAVRVCTGSAFALPMCYTVPALVLQKHCAGGTTLVLQKHFTGTVLVSH